MDRVLLVAMEEAEGESHMEDKTLEPVDVVLVGDVVNVVVADTEAVGRDIGGM
jgi:hypothetical protein